MLSCACGTTGRAAAWPRCQVRSSYRGEDWVDAGWMPCMCQRIHRRTLLQLALRQRRAVVIAGHAGGTVCLDLSPDGNLLATAGMDAQGRQDLVYWDVSACWAAGNSGGSGGRPREVARLCSDYNVQAVRFVPYDPERVVTCGKNSIRVYRCACTRARMQRAPAATVLAAVDCTCTHMLSAMQLTQLNAACDVMQPKQLNAACDVMQHLSALSVRPLSALRGMQAEGRAAARPVGVDGGGAGAAGAAAAALLLWHPGQPHQHHGWGGVHLPGL